MGKGDLGAERAYSYKSLSWDQLLPPLLNIFKFNFKKKNLRASLEISIVSLGTLNLIRDADLKWIFHFLLQGIGGIMLLLVDDVYFELFLLTPSQINSVCFLIFKKEANLFLVDLFKWSTNKKLTAMYYWL